MAPLHQSNPLRTYASKGPDVYYVHCPTHLRCILKVPAQTPDNILLSLESGPIPSNLLVAAMQI